MPEYTGLADWPARKASPGILELARLWHETTPTWWNNGTYGIRPTRSGRSQSVHGTGRALDMSRRPKTGGYGPRSDVEAWAELLATFSDVLGIELITDYGHKPHGRTWRCDRDAWKDAAPGTLSGGGTVWGDWLHVEINPAMAADPAGLAEAWSAMLDAMRLVPATTPPKAADKPASKPRKKAANPTGS